MFHHIVLMKWHKEISEQAVEEISSALDRLHAKTSLLLDYRHGIDLGIGEGNWDYAVIATFANKKHYEIFRDDPEHRELIEKLILPWRFKLAAIQIKGKLNFLAKISYENNQI